MQPCANQNQSYPDTKWFMRVRAANTRAEVANHHRAADRLATPKDGLLNLPTSSNFIAGLVYAAMCGGPSRCGVCRRQACITSASPIMPTHAHNPAAPGEAAASRQQPR